MNRHVSKFKYKNVFMKSQNLKQGFGSFLHRIISSVIFLAFFIGSLHPIASVYGQNTFNLSNPGYRAPLEVFAPTVIKGMTVNPLNPFEFDFIVDVGDSNFAGGALREESETLIKYFLAALTIPEEELWVNLSPYQKNRIIPEAFGQTKMGRDLLAEDYLLKQMTASLMHPEGQAGKHFWEKIYAEVYRRYGTTDIPVNIFNKVWIMPDKASVYENDSQVFIVEQNMKVMLEEDYLALGKNRQESNEVSKILEGMIRETILPVLRQEINKGKNFSKLRQIYHSMILATWFKQNLKQSLLGQAYANQRKVKGVAIPDKEAKYKIYKKYLEDFKQGAYNYIKEDYDPIGHDMVWRKYFSGGIIGNIEITKEDKAMLGDRFRGEWEGLKKRMFIVKSFFQKIISKEATAEIQNTISPKGVKVLDFYDAAILSDREKTISDNTGIIKGGENFFRNIFFNLGKNLFYRSKKPFIPLELSAKEVLNLNSEEFPGGYLYVMRLHGKHEDGYQILEAPDEASVSLEGYWREDFHYVLKQLGKNKIIALVGGSKRTDWIYNAVFQYWHEKKLTGESFYNLKALRNQPNPYEEILTRVSSQLINKKKERVHGIGFEDINPLENKDFYRGEMIQWLKSVPIKSVLVKSSKGELNSYKKEFLRNLFGGTSKMSFFRKKEDLSMIEFGLKPFNRGQFAEFLDFVITEDKIFFENENLKKFINQNLDLLLDLSLSYPIFPQTVKKILYELNHSYLKGPLFPEELVEIVENIFASLKLVKVSSLKNSQSDIVSSKKEEPIFKTTESWIDENKFLYGLITFDFIQKEKEKSRQYPTIAVDMDETLLFSLWSDNEKKEVFLRPKIYEQLKHLKEFYGYRLVLLTRSSQYITQKNFFGNPRFYEEDFLREDILPINLIRNLTKASNESMPSLRVDFRMIDWLNKSTLPYQLLQKKKIADWGFDDRESFSLAKIEKKYKKSFSELSLDELKHLTSTYDGKYFKRRICIKFFPSLTPAMTPSLPIEISELFDLFITSENYDDSFSKVDLIYRLGYVGLIDDKEEYFHEWERHPLREFFMVYTIEEFQEGKEDLETMDQLANTVHSQIEFIQGPMNGKRGEKQETDQSILSKNNSNDFGGIDLNPKGLTLQAQGKKVKFDLSVDEAMITEMMQADGLVPIVTTISPMTSLPLWLEFLGAGY